jgi:thiomorpholine-carboxylate dehydrogenase
MPILTVSEDQVRALLTYPDLIPVIRTALADFSAGRTLQPVRQVIRIPESPGISQPGWFGLMPAIYGDVMGAKLVCFNPANTALHKHTHHAMIQLFHSATGEPIATLDGRIITERRTAAVSAVAVDHLAPTSASTLAILGSGVQARSHLAALQHVRNFTSVRVWSRNPAHATAFAHETHSQTAPTPEAAVTGADVVITVTSSIQPILEGRWLQPSAIVCAVGSCTPDRRELDDHAMRGTVLVDSRAAALKESGDLLLSAATITAELGELLNGTPLNPNGQPIIFKSLGLAIEDIAAAKLVYEKLLATSWQTPSGS